MAKTIYNESELTGMIKILIELFEANEGKFDEILGLGFNIKKIERTYNVEFCWQGKTILVALSTHDHEPEYDRRDHTSDFMILEDESLSKLEQYVNDILFEVKETEL